MQRVACKHLFLLICAAAITYVVAWTCTLVGRARVGTSPQIQETPAGWISTVPGEWPSPTERTRYQAFLGFEYVNTQAQKFNLRDVGTDDPRDVPSQNSMLAGLPLRGLQCHSTLVAQLVRNPRGGFVMHGEDQAQWTGAISMQWLFGTDSPSLPVTPRWPEFLLDVAAYFAMLEAPGVLRACVRAIRRNRGRCVACGYALTAAQATCPECGAQRGAG